MTSLENASMTGREIIKMDRPATGWTSDQMSNEAKNEAKLPTEEEWQPSKHEKAIIYTIAFLNLIVSLDATIIVTALAVW